MSLRLAVLASGGGTTLQNLIDKIDAGQLDASIALVIASRAGIGALEKARRAGIKTVVVEAPRNEVADFSQRIFAACREENVELVVAAGFLRLIHIPEDFAGRVVNIHPALIPSFCGKGYYGERVHQAVLDRGVKISGCTVHFCDNVYDHGPIILQRAVEVVEGDTAKSLAERVFAAECEALPAAIRLFAQNRLRIQGATVRVLSVENA